MNPGEPNHAPVVSTNPPLTYEIGQPPPTLAGTVTDDGEPRGAAVTLSVVAIRRPRAPSPQACDARGAR